MIFLNLHISRYGAPNRMISNQKLTYKVS